MTRSRFIALIAGAVLIGSSAIALWNHSKQVQTPAQSAPEAATTAGIDVGIALDAKAPVGLALQNSTGNETTLAGQMGEKGLVLLLVRSAGWCPYCKAQLIQTVQIEDTVAERGYALASLSYDQPNVLAEFKADQGIGYAMLSDPHSRMIDALSLRDPQYGPDSKAYGVPRAAILVLTPDGTVKAKYVTDDFRRRPANEDVIAMIDGAAS
jgi:peroxiredoxin